MIINSIYVKKFRGFNEVQFELGNNLTVIAGQNGTQKTTLLGMLSQPFTIGRESLLYGEKPLCGGNYKSLFSEKFKLSHSFDIPQDHEWTLNLRNEPEPFTIESIKRGSSGEIRFWRKGLRSKGSGYIQLPVIYLSLSRLFPIGEDSDLDSSNEITISESEFEFYQKYHNEILLTRDVEMTGVDYLSSKQKNTIGVNTDFYDWKMNSAGQDNIGKILLSILSFNRLQLKYKENYQGGILAIDELDTTLYPASQLKLIELLRKFSSQLKIQIIFTTHSLTILEKACEWQQDSRIKGQISVIYLQKFDKKVKPIVNPSFEVIKNKLNVAMSIKTKAKKVSVFSEDKEGEIFLKAILKRKASSLQFINCTMGCDNYIELARKKIDGFKFPQSIIVLDGDIKSKLAKVKELKKYKNFLLLPGTKPVEALIAEFLYKTSDESDLWSDIDSEYSKQIAFRDTSLRDIQTDRIKAKKWFNQQKQYWGRNCANVFNPWIINNQSEVLSFVKEYEKLIDKYNVNLS
jgi:hypothetical protein